MTDSKNNSGHYNSGSRNSGNYNSGHYNYGHFNSGYCNSGSFNTTTPETANFFNKPLSFKEWNKVTKPLWLFKAKPTFWNGGTLVKTDLKEEWKKALKSASKEDVQKVVDLPNFDASVFKKITGLEIGGESKPTCDGEIVVIKGEEYRLERV